ncbi:acetyltransferase, gnat family [Citreicella sp. SE45]|uniref:GNAT family N-acetyltransferase n=1 Tax=Salipiger sp. HF18 TaxID=2721557 RepID=UPI0001B8C6E8|nr:GNAT family N-acetyltransferase [Salipiger sp. HF18]EEX12812.1 acetyltransferase, gnat family [Citreicella sp. SE45]NIY94976.1 N-acetyltransferase [Salipiger sp. HF18]
MITVRRAGPLDARPMAELLNEVIAIGGTTAITEPVTREDLLNWMEADPRSIWHVAEDATGQIMGFQWVDPHLKLGETVAQIASFARVGKTGLGIGSKLFDATKRAARTAGYAWINAEIRADNEGGLIYYQSRGFEDYGRIEGYVMANGQVVDKVLKRYDL